MIINAAWGLGEAIVGGLVSPDTITVDKATGEVEEVRGRGEDCDHGTDEIRHEGGTA